MASHISQGTCAELNPSTPEDRGIDRMVRARLGGPEPQVPVQRIRDLRGICGPRQPGGKAISTLRPIGPGVNFTNLADCTVPDPFAAPADRFRRVTLIPHLCGNIVFACCLGKFARFVERMGQRFLAKHVFAALDSRHGGDIVGVVRGSNDDGIDLFSHFLEHHAEIAIEFRVRVSASSTAGICPIDVTKSNNVFTFHPVQVPASPVTNAYPGDI